MNEKGKPAERERRDWTIILIILLLGLLCVILAGERAIRFSPNWKLDTNMRSNLDPDSDFLTNKPVYFYEPLDPSILTQPVWINVFLTPGALFKTRTPLPLTNTPLGTNTPVPTLFYSPTAIKPTNTQAAILPSPTNTFIYYPPPPPPSTPKPPPTNTPINPLPTADLSITKDDGAVFVNTGDVVTYTVRVTNNGPNNVTGAILSDPVSTGLTKRTAVACSVTPGQCVTPPTSADLESGTFALPALSNGQFYEIAITTDVTASSGSVTNTANVSVPAGINDPDASNNSALDTNTLNVNADLSITITDNSTAYEAGAVKLLPNVPPYAYTITVSNAGPSNVTGATVSNVFSNGNIDTSFKAWGWICTPSAGASCSAAFGPGNLNNQSVNLNSGSSVTFYLAVQVVASPTGDLVNDVTVTAPGGVTDPPGNNSATDKDNLIIPNVTPPAIGTTPDNTPYIIPAGTYLTIQFGTPLDVGSGKYLVYYELPQGANPGVWMDAVILQVGDGSNWYTILNWGNSSPDTNTNISVPLLPPNPTDCAGEPDNCPIDASLLYTSAGYSTGITINVDGVVPNGTYPYIRIFSPPGAPGGPDTDDQVEVDAIAILP